MLFGNIFGNFPQRRCRPKNVFNVVSYACGDSGYDDAWDLVDNDVIDIDDLAVFLGSWLR